MRDKNLLILNQKVTKNNLPSFDYHMHTNWTDGANTVNEMHRAAVKKGLSHILFSEHARLNSTTWFLDFAREVRSCEKTRCHALVGVETKILNFEGDLDLCPVIWNECDLVMASVHRFPGEKEIKNELFDHFLIKSDYQDPIETEFKLANLILENPMVDILGHPFGMTYRRFNLVPPQKMMVDLIKKAAKTGVAFEINSRYHPNLWELIDWCKEYGAIISLGSNAHSINEVGSIIEKLKEEVNYETN